MDDPSPSRVKQLASRFGPQVSKVQRIASMFECEPPSPSTAISLSRRVGGNSTAKIQYKRSQSDRPSLTGDPQQPVRRQPIPSPRTVETPVLRSEPSREFVGGGEQLAEEQLTEEQLAEEGLDGMSMEEMEALCEIMALEESQARAARMEALGYEVAGGEGREEYRKEGDGGEGGWWQVGYSDGPAGGEASGSGEAEGGRTEGGEGVAVVIGDDGEGDNKEGGSVGSLIRSIEGLPKQSKQQPPPLSPEKTPGKSRKSSGGKKSREKRRGEPGGAETVAGAIERFSGSGKDPVRVSTSRMTASTSEPSLALAAAGATAGNRRYGLANGGTASPMEDRPAEMAGGGAARGSAGLSGEFPLELSSSPSVSVVDAELSRKKTEVARYETELARRRAELNRLRVELASVSVEKVQADIALNRLKQEVEDWSYVPADGTGQGRNEADEAGEAGESGAPDVKKDGDGGSSEGNSSPGRLKAQLGKVRLENERLKRREKSLTADVEYIETMLAQEKGESAALRRELAEVKQQRKDLDKELSAAQKELSSLRRSAAVAERRAAAEEADAALLRQQLQKAQAAEMGLLEQLQLATKEAMGLRKTLVWSKETREDAEEWERGLQGTLAEQVQRNGELEVKGGEMMTRLLVLEKELAEEQQRRSAAEFQARDAVAAKELLEEEVMLLRHTRGAMKDAWAVGEGKEGGVDGGEGRRASSRAEEGAGDRNAKVASSDGLKMEVPARVWDILDQVEETKARGMAERDELTRLHWLTACVRGELHKARFAAMQAAASTNPTATATATATAGSSPAPPLVPAAGLAKPMGKAVSKKLSLVVDLDQHAAASAPAAPPDSAAASAASATSASGTTFSTTASTPRTPPHSTTAASASASASAGSKFVRWFSHRSDRPAHSSAAGAAAVPAASTATVESAAAAAADEGSASPQAPDPVPRVATAESLPSLATTSLLPAQSAPSTPAPAAATAVPAAAAAATTPSARKHHLLSFRRMTSHK